MSPIDDDAGLDEPPAFGTVLPAPTSSLSRIIPAEPPQVPSRPRLTVVVAVAAVASAAALALGVLVVRWSSQAGTPDGLDPSHIAVAPENSSIGADPTLRDRPVAADIGVAAPADPGTCPEGMAEIEGGKFFMGTDANDAPLRGANPAHRQRVESFCIDKTEVTVDAYRACSVHADCKRAYRDSLWPQGAATKATWTASRTAYSALCNEAHNDRGQHPMNCVTWDQAQEYCQWRGGRLPTEAQWEFAARGADGRVYSWGDHVPDSEHMNGCGSECLAWREQAGLPPTPQLYSADDGYPGTAPVGSFPAGRTKAGLLDMAGNVFEWTADEFRPYVAIGDEAEGARKGRVIRGGAFNSFMPQFADPALRFAQAESAHSHGIGFRCVADPA